jgi:hypothetical protein
MMPIQFILLLIALFPTFLLSHSIEWIALHRKMTRQLARMKGSTPFAALDISI